MLSPTCDACGRAIPVAALPWGGGLVEGVELVRLGAVEEPVWFCWPCHDARRDFEVCAARAREAAGLAPGEPGEVSW